VEIGNWEHLTGYPLTTFAILYGSGVVLDRPITLDQPVYLPGNELQGVWASPLLETVFGPKPKGDRQPAPGKAVGFSLQGDLEMAVFVAGELRRSYAEEPQRWLLEIISRMSWGVETPSVKLGSARDEPHHAPEARIATADGAVVPVPFPGGR
jgi:hypothetical protein